MRNVGECSIEDADSANIPVNIFLTLKSEDDDDDFDEDEDKDDLFEKPDEETEEIEAKEEVHTHVLTADNFMPRKGRAEDGAYKVYGTESELREAVKKHILPLYQIALENISGMASGKINSHYYWDKEEEIEENDDE